MGYLAKHVKVRRQKEALMLIATAALRGAMFKRTDNGGVPGNYTYWYVGDTQEEFGRTWGKSKSKCARKYHAYCDRKSLAAWDRGPTQAIGNHGRAERMVMPP